jgi:tetratricopeptide (TPR) repeat protein
LKLPNNISTLLQQQLDNLTTIEKKILRGASAIGERFSYHILAELLEMNLSNLQNGMRRLSTKNGYIYELRLYPEPEYAFNHSLIRESIYSTLLTNLRKPLHAKLFNILESSFKKEDINQMQLLANHSYLGEVWDKAFIYCDLSGDYLFNISAYELAAWQYERAVTAAEQLPKSDDTIQKCFHLHVQLSALYRRLGLPKTEETHITHALELAILYKNAEMECGAYVLKSTYTQSRGDTQKAYEFALHAHELAIKIQQVDLIIAAKIAVMLVAFFMGQYQKQYQLTKEIADLIINENYQSPWYKLPVWSFINITAQYARFYTGDTIPIIKSIKAIQMEIDIHQPTLNSFYGTLKIAFMYLYLGKYDNAEKYLQIALQHANDLGIIIYVPTINAALACCYFVHRQTEKGKEYLEYALDTFQTVKSYLARGPALDFISEALMLEKNYQKAKIFIADAILMAAEASMDGIKLVLRWKMAEIDLCLPNPNYEEIQKKLENLIQASENLGMQRYVARCQFSLAKLYKQVGKKSASLEAYEAANIIYLKLGITHDVLLNVTFLR